MRINPERYSDDTDDPLGLVYYHPHYDSSTTRPILTTTTPVTNVSNHDHTYKLNTAEVSATPELDETHDAHIPRFGNCPTSRINHREGIGAGGLSAQVACAHSTPGCLQSSRFPNRTPPVVTNTSELKAGPKLVHVSLDDGDVIFMSRGDLEDYAWNAVTLMAVGKTELELALEIGMG